MLELDGSLGEGGGQVLRTALSLAMITGTPFRITKIRAGRARPGLMRQHLTAIEAAAEVSGAEVEGARPSSTELEFRPGPIRGGRYRFSVGTAGSATLVFQTLLPALLEADGPSSLVLEGGTHNPASPPFDFLARTFAPVLRRLGAELELELERPGFYPAGGGRFRAEVRPSRLRPIELLERGPVRLSAEARVAGLPPKILHRELKVLGDALGLDRAARVARELDPRFGPGNVVLVDVASEGLVEVFTAFGEKGVPAEAVAERLAAEVSAHLATGAPVGPHLADQLLLPLARAGGGRFRAGPLTEHAKTQREIVSRFLAVRIGVDEATGIVAVEA